MTDIVYPHTFHYFRQQIVYTRSNCESLRQKLQHATDAVDYPADNARELAEVIKQLIEAVELQLEFKLHTKLLKLEASYDGDKLEDRKYSNEVFRLNRRINYTTRVISKLTPLIKYVEGSHAENNPWGIVRFVDYFCRHLYNGARVIVRPRWQYNYTYTSLSEQLEDIAIAAGIADKGLFKAFREILGTGIEFFSLAYPPTTSHNLLLMALWSHELGHMINNVGGNIISSNGREEDIDFSTDPLTEEIVELHTVQVELDNLQKMTDAVKSVDGGWWVYKGKPLEAKRKIELAIQRQLEVWAGEIFADLCAVRLFGPAAIFAYFEFSYPVDSDEKENSLYHPPLELRLEIMLKALNRWQQSDPLWFENLPEDAVTNYLNQIDHLERLSRGELPSMVWSAKRSKTEFEKLLQTEVTSNALKLVEPIQNEVDRIVEYRESCFLNTDDMHMIEGILQEIKNDMPPDTAFVNGNSLSHKAFSVLVNTGWLFWIAQFGNQTAPGDNDGRIQTDDAAQERYRQYSSGIGEGPGGEDRLEKYRGVNQLLLKSVSDVEAQRWYGQREQFGRRPPRRVASVNRAADVLNPHIAGVLGRNELKYRMDRSCDEQERLIMRPLLDEDSQIGTCSIDVRLSNEYIITRRPVLPELDPTDLEVRSSTLQFYQKLYLPYGKPFILHPGQFVLGSTLEYIATPYDLMGLIIGRSSLAHLGLVIATSFKIIPGFRGCATLELTNLGDAPILLYPCSRIAQIVFNTIKHWAPPNGLNVH